MTAQQTFKEHLEQAGKTVSRWPVWKQDLLGSPAAQPTPGPWIDVHGGLDSFGRASFTVYWLTDYHPGHPAGETGIDIRGQVYFADPSRFAGHADWANGTAARAAIARATATE